MLNVVKLHINILIFLTYRNNYFLLANLIAIFVFKDLDGLLVT